MERSIETQVSQAVDAWLRWLPRWEPATHRGRVAPCRRCIGSPVLSAAGLGADVPHGVQHGLSTRVKTIIDHAVAEYTSLNLPMLQAELDQQAARSSAGFSSEFYGEAVSEELFLQTLDASIARGERSLEVMCHPAYVDRIIMGSAYCYPRLDELDVLTSASLKAAVADRGYRLGTYRDV